MWHMIVSLLSVLALISCSGAVVEDCKLQNSYRNVWGILPGDIYGGAANWAVICGYGNMLLQDSHQPLGTGPAIVNLKAMSMAMIVGELRRDTGKNSTASIDVEKMSQLLAMGSGCGPEWGNDARWRTDEGKVEQDQNNFEIILGEMSNMNQANCADGLNIYMMKVTQAESRVTYLYGMSNSTAQEKGIYGYAGPYTGMTNQTVKNLAFAISSSARPEYMPSYSIPSNGGLPLFSPLCSCVT